MDSFNNGGSNYLIEDAELQDVDVYSYNMIQAEQNNYLPEHEYSDATSNGPIGDESVDFILSYIDTQNPNFAEKRSIFEKSLMEQGLQLEYEHNSQFHFVKIFAPKEVLCRYCEIMKIRMPMKEEPNIEEIEANSDIFNDAKSWFIRLFSCAQLDPKKFPVKKYRLATEFSRDKDYLFDTKEESFFPASLKAMVVYFILERESEGIERLLGEGVYSAAYPLHDGNYKDCESTRTLLYNEWASMEKCLKLQPLDTIQEYFGVNFAIYFAWLGYYTCMLIPASIFGVCCFLYALIHESLKTSDRDECSDWANQVIMCPQCDKTCGYWRLNVTCGISKIIHIFDNPAITVFAVFMTFWSVLYLELWKRRSAELTYRWGLVGWDRTAEHPRPQYLESVAKLRYVKAKQKINAVTREKELHVSFWKLRVPVTIASFFIVILLVLVAVAVVFGVVLYRMAVMATRSIFLQQGGDTARVFSPHEEIMISVISAGINLICIIALNYVYDWIALYLTELELWRTQAEFDDSLTLKIYLFQFINYYSSIFYIAFLKGKWVGYPKKYIRVLGFRQEECLPGGCLWELCIQLVIIMIGKQALYTVLEMIYPKLQKSWTFFRIQVGLEQKDQKTKRKPWARDMMLLEWGPRGLYDEYLEMVIQFGFITLFVVAFPLAPLFALMNNVLEMRLDAKKFLRYYRRPVPRRTRDIGVWSQILDGLARISIITNAFIIAFSSNFIPRLVYKYTESPDATEMGFLNFSLSYFETKDFENDTAPENSSIRNITTCRYSGYYYTSDHPTLPYKKAYVYYRILSARFLFVVIFQNVVGLLTMVVQWCLSGTPRKLRDHIKREAYLTEELIIKREAERARERLMAQNNFLNVGHRLRKKVQNKNQEDTRV